MECQEGFNLFKRLVCVTEEGESVGGVKASQKRGQFPGGHPEKSLQGTLKIAVAEIPLGTERSWLESQLLQSWRNLCVALCSSALLHSSV